MRSAGWTGSVSVLDRVTALFDAFSDPDAGMGVTELARRARLPKSTVSRLVADLVAQRLLDREGDRLYLGIRLFEFGQTVEQPRRLRAAALPVMAELRNVSGQTVHLALPDGAEVVVISVARAEAAPPSPVAVGSRLPAHATALGKALLAFSDEALPFPDGAALARLTSRTVHDRALLARELEQVRRTGIAREVEECAPGRACVASAVLSLGVSPIAAIAVAGSPDSIVSSRVVPAVRTAATTLARRLDAHRDL